MASIKETRDAIKSLPGMTALHTDGEWRVTINLYRLSERYPDKGRAWCEEKQEGMAYYTTDADDALATAKKISESWVSEAKLFSNSNSNIKVFGKLEDPTDTLVLFEKKEVEASTEDNSQYMNIQQRRDFLRSRVINSCVQSGMIKEDLLSVVDALERIASWDANKQLVYTLYQEVDLVFDKLPSDEIKNDFKQILLLTESAGDYLEHPLLAEQSDESETPVWAIDHRGDALVGDKIDEIVDADEYHDELNRKSYCRP